MLREKARRASSLEHSLEIDDGPPLDAGASPGPTVVVTPAQTTTRTTTTTTTTTTARKDDWLCVRLWRLDVDDAESCQETDRDRSSVPETTENPHARALEEQISRSNSLTPALVLVLIGVGGYVWALDMQDTGTAPFVWRGAPGPAGGFVGALAYASAIVGGIILLTYLFVAVIAFRMRRAAFFAVFAVVVGFLSGFVGFLALSALRARPAPLDAVTLALLLWNWGVGGALAVMLEGAPPRLAKLFLLLFSVALSWPLCSLPEWTLWILVLEMVVWDVLAVLTPCGPLGYAMRLEQYRKHMGEEAFRMPPGLLYDAGLYQLGTMDLVFYGVVCGRGAIVSMQCYVACAVGILVGALVTIAATPPSRTIPALPIALAIGVACYFAGRHTLFPLTDDFARSFRAL